MTYPEPFKLSALARERRAQRDRRDGLKHLTHVDGLCGMEVAACCEACYQDEKREMLAWAATAPDPLPDETPDAYWSRLSNIVREMAPEKTSGMYFDCWLEVAHTIIKQRRREEVTP